MVVSKVRLSRDGYWENTDWKWRQAVSKEMCQDTCVIASIGLDVLGDEAHALGDCNRLHKEKMELFVDIKVELCEKELADGDATSLFELFKHLHGLDEEIQCRFWRKLASIVWNMDDLINKENPAMQWKGYGVKRYAKKSKLIKTRVGLPLG